MKETALAEKTSALGCVSSMGTLVEVSKSAQTWMIVFFGGEKGCRGLCRGYRRLIWYEDGRL